MTEQRDIVVWWRTLDEQTRAAVSDLFAVSDTCAMALRGSRTAQGTKRRLVVNRGLLEQIETDYDAYDQAFEFLAFEYLLDQANAIHWEPPLRTFYIGGCVRVYRTDEMLSPNTGMAAEQVAARRFPLTNCTALVGADT